MNPLARIGALLTCCCLAAMTAGCERLRPAAAGVQLKPGDPQVRAAGRVVYEKHCAACHGARLEGQANWREPNAAGLLPAPPHDDSGHTWHHPDDLLFRITKYGVARAANLPEHKSAMPAYEGVLVDSEIVAVLSWIKSRWSAEVQARHDSINEAASRKR